MSPHSAPRFTTRPELRGTFGVAASTHWLASQSAIPERRQHRSVPRNRARIIPGTGLLAALVPGAFDAWMTMLRDYGTISLAEGMETAIGYAEKVYPIAHAAVETIGAVADMMREHWPSSAEIYLPAREPPMAGSLHRNPGLAGTWKRLLGEAQAAGGDRISVEAARRAFYEGFVAEAIDDFCRSRPHLDMTGQKNGGLLPGDGRPCHRCCLHNGPNVLETRTVTEGTHVKSPDGGGRSRDAFCTC